MAQNDMNIANQGFPGFRADLNDALGALVSNSSGATAPATTFAHQLWVDTSADPSVLKIRNADNDAFIPICSIDQTNDKITVLNATQIKVGSVTYTLPTADGTSGQVIETNGSGTLSFSTPASTSDKIEEGDSKVEVTDAGTGKVEITVDNVEVADFTTGAIVFNETGANQDFRVEGDTNANLLFVDASTDAVGIGTSSPATDAQLTLAADETVNLFFQRTGSGNVDAAIQVGGSGHMLFKGNADASTAAGLTELARITNTGDLRFNSGFGSVGLAFGCRAWVNFNGVGTVAIRGSGNVSSITDTGTGTYTVNFTTSMPDVNYNAQMSCKVQVTHTSVSNNLEVFAAGNIEVAHFENALPQDCSVVTVSIFR